MPGYLLAIALTQEMTRSCHSTRHKLQQGQFRQGGMGHTPNACGPQGASCSGVVKGLRVCLGDIRRLVIKEEHVSVLHARLFPDVGQVRLVLLGAVHVMAAGGWDELDALKHVCDACSRRSRRSLIMLSHTLSV